MQSKKVKTNAALGLPSEIQTLDMETSWLKDLIAGRIDVPSFESDGAKFDSGDAPGLLQRLERELNEKQAELKKTDERLFRCFVERAGKESKCKALEYISLQPHQ